MRVGILKIKKIYNKTDIIYQGCQWTAYTNDNPKVTENLDRTRFNINEGYEVLYLINFFTKEWNLNQRLSKKIENR